MDPPRPGFLDLRSQSQASITRPLKSPRLHVAGDVPPELSPLDAFALQSRLLAKQLEESAKSDRRMSRLPPLTTDSPLVLQGHSDYFRSRTQDSYSDSENGLASPNLSGSAQAQPSSQSQPMTPTGFSTRTPEVEEPLVRPQSMHPRMSRMPPLSGDGDSTAPPPVPAYSRERQRLLQQQQPLAENDAGDPGFFGARRERSPSPMAEDLSETQRQRDATVSALESGSSVNIASSADGAALPKEAFSFQEPAGHPQPQQMPAAAQLQQLHQNPPTLASPPSVYSNTNLHPLTQSPEKSPVKKNSFDSATGGLAPPRQLFPKRSSSILSSPLLNAADIDSNSALGASYHSLGARKLSNSSSMVSPGFGSFHRSPSFGSDMSAQLPRPSFNFSRPLSRVSTPGLESPARQASSDSHTSYSQSSFVFADDTAHTPVSVHSEGFPDTASTQPDDNGTAAAPLYVYSKYSLPRGKMLQRSGPLPPDSQMPAASYQWEQPMVLPSNVQTFPLGGGQAPPSPPSRPSSSIGLAPRPSLERTKLSMELTREPSAESCAPAFAPFHQQTPSSSRPSTEETRGRPSEAFSHDASMRARTPASIAATADTNATSDSASTIKPRSTQTLASAVDIPADEHVDLAIKLHEQGQLSESTYHLRLAARQGHPTGMLLYALACRHGWGMRANPREGAIWLRKAADCASLEIADDEAQIKDGKSVDVVDHKTRKAQFALSIYELGVSYMNGWGIDQDRALGLRCFEIAGSWGDVDALAEAGFCYAQGLGCKKNLKRSAHFYRQAEAKGMSMVGNSWIHKGKYNDDKDKNSAKSSKEQKVRSKSRSRNIFGIKHST